ncbi:MAG: restriction endonuclease subunit S [Candidatus Anammoxibacter sp.]
MELYERYKDSGIEWIGEIPEHWEVKKLKYLANIVLGKMLTNSDKGDYKKRKYLRAANIEWIKLNADDIKEMWFSDEELRRLRLKTNDLLVSEGGEVGRTCIWKNELDECYIQNSVHKATINSLNYPSYFLYQFYIFGQKGAFDSIVNRISIAHLTGDKIKEINFICPLLKEQTTIANYLDRKTAEIDDLIAKKERLLTLYEEEKTAIINQAVTKGISPDVKLKDSGIEWLGGTPDHWEVKKFKYFFALITEKNGTDGKKIGLENIESKSGKFVETDSVFEGNGISFRVNDILYGKLRPYLAKVYLAEFNGNAVGDFYVFRTKGEVLVQFGSLRLLDYSFIYTTNSSTFGAKMPRVSWDYIANLEIAFPKIDEQKSIVSHIIRETTRINAKAEKTKKLIDLQKEYRTALISEVVTGKIKIT